MRRDRHTPEGSTARRTTARLPAPDVGTTLALTAVVLATTLLVVADLTATTAVAGTAGLLVARVRRATRD